MCFQSLLDENSHHVLLETRLIRAQRRSEPKREVAGCKNQSKVLKDAKMLREAEGNCGAGR